jgi:V/A-type H+-transporting ATPase subunit F
MSMRVRAITGPGLATGFQLAGFAVDEVSSAREASDRVLAALEQPDLGILLVEQRLLDALPIAVRRDAERRPVPVLVPIPAPAWAGRTDDAERFILELLRRAIGYRVRLQ